MRLKTFRARRMDEAMALLREELGAEAIILATRRSATGVEITAALEAEEPLLIPPAAPVAPPSAPLGPLAFHNLPAPLAASLARGKLDEALAGTLGFAPLPDGQDRPVMLVGPPGAGKTLTCAKLAARLVLAGAPPVVATTDGHRAGAAAQLAAFTGVLGLTLAVAPSAASLCKAMARRRPGQPALVDSAGCDPFDTRQAVALHALAAAAGAELVLVLPAGLDAQEAAELARAFAALGARHLLPTRLDAARRLGGVLAAAEAGPLLLTEAGISPEVVDGLEPLSPARLAARLVAAPRRDALHTAEEAAS
jgi:flagellar biosynthesis protein FlhF